MVRPDSRGRGGQTGACVRVMEPSLYTKKTKRGDILEPMRWIIRKLKGEVEYDKEWFKHMDKVPTGYCV